MGNAVVHFEIGGPDDAPLIAFYGELFGWKLQPFEGGGYTLIDTCGGGGINGGIGKSQTGEPWSTFYVEAGDLQAVLGKAESLGAKTVMPVTDFGGAVTIAMFNDPDGLLVGLVKAADPAQGEAPGPSAGTGEPVDWFEVLGSDSGRTQRFYADLFGWTVGGGESGTPPSYGMADTGAGRGIQGGLGSSEAAHWATIYASVPDVEQTLAKAESLGGSRIYGPMAVDDHMQTGAFRDPAGNVFGIYHHGAH
jgi:predicted enzyme related to lactoylglutathione lyase